MRVDSKPFVEDHEHQVPDQTLQEDHLRNENTENINYFPFEPEIKIAFVLMLISLI